MSADELSRISPAHRHRNAWSLLVALAACLQDNGVHHVSETVVYIFPSHVLHFDSYLFPSASYPLTLER